MTDKEEQQMIERYDEVIRIGEITLASQRLSVNELAGIILSLLKEPEVKEYLDLLKKKKALGNTYLG